MILSSTRTISALFSWRGAFSMRASIFSTRMWHLPMATPMSLLPLRPLMRAKQHQTMVLVKETNPLWLPCKSLETAWRLCAIWFQTWLCQGWRKYFAPAASLLWRIIPNVLTWNLAWRSTGLASTTTRSVSWLSIFATRCGGKNVCLPLRSRLWRNWNSSTRTGKLTWAEHPRRGEVGAV